MLAICFLFPATLFGQYRVTSQGANYGNGGAYVAPVVTRTFDVKPLPYTPPVRSSYGSGSSSSPYSGGTKSNSSGSSSRSGSNSTSYTPAAKAAPATAEDYYYAGNAKYLDKEYAAAIMHYEKATRLDPGKAEYYLSIGQAKYQLKDYAGAIPQFDKAIKLVPAYQQAYMGRGDSKQMLEDYAGAVEDYNLSISLEPYASTYYSRGLAHYNLEHFSEAAADFTKTIELCDEVQKKWDAERIKSFGKSAKAPAQRDIEREPMYAGSFSGRGSVKMKQRDFPAALKDYNRAIEINQTDGQAYYTRALIILVTGTKEDGCADLAKASGLGYKAADDLIAKYCQ
jgi:tetratricopeptide (TPR) repeat protein